MLGLALCGIGVELLQALLKSLQGELAEIVPDRQAFRCRVMWQLRAAQVKREMATTGNFCRVGQSRGDVGEQLLHLLGAVEILLVREAAHPALVAQNFAFGDANACLVGFKAVGCQKLHGVRGHHGQLHALRQHHGGSNVRLVVAAARTLKLNVEPVGEGGGALQRHIMRLRQVGPQKGGPQRTCLRARKHDQAVAQFLQPGPLQCGLLLVANGQPAAG